MTKSEDFVYLPHFNVPMEREIDQHVYRGDGVTIVALPVAHGWELSLAAKDGARFSIVVEGRTLAEAEAALVKAMGRAEDVLTAALMQVSVECRHSGESRAA